MRLNFDKYFFNKSMEKNYTDNDCCRMAAYYVQDKCCYVTGQYLKTGCRQLHHRLPQHYGGTDEAENLILLNDKIHRMVHTEDRSEFYRLKRNFSLTDYQLALINQLRFEAHREPVKA